VEELRPGAFEGTHCWIIAADNGYKAQRVIILLGDFNVRMLPICSSLQWSGSQFMTPPVTQAVCTIGLILRSVIDNVNGQLDLADSIAVAALGSITSIVTSAVVATVITGFSS
jgi:hypothetical protein